MVDHARLELALAEFAQLLLGEFAVPDVLQRLCQHAASLLPVLGAGVTLVDADGLHAGWSSGPTAEELEALQRRLGEGPCLDVLSTGAPVHAVLPGEKRWPRYAPAAAGLGVGSLVALPLMARGRVLGVFDVYRVEASGFADDEVRAVLVLVDTAAAYLVTARDRLARRVADDQLRLMALHDPLTGLPNRLLLLDRMSQALAVVDRLPGSVGLLFVDLDRFKQINDAHGHVVGDRVLAEVAHRLSTALRPTDTVARLGGDEFVVLCEDLHLVEGDLDTVAARLLVALTRPVPLPEPPGGEVVVRASIGSSGSRPATAPRRPSATPTGPCTPPSSAEEASSGLTGGPTSRRRSACAWTRSCSTCSTGASCDWPSSRSSTFATAPTGAWRPSCAGSTPSGACWTPVSSCRLWSAPA